MPNDILQMFEPFGLLGLVVGSLVIFILLFLAILERKDKHHMRFLDRILSESRQEREATTDRFSKSTDRLSDAITDLTKSLKNHD